MNEQRSCFLHGDYAGPVCPKCPATRMLTFGTNDFDHASAVLGVKERCVEITRAQSEEWSSALAVRTGNPRVDRKRRSMARQVWDTWHGPYDAPPPWDDLDKTRRNA